MLFKDNVFLNKQIPLNIQHSTTAEERKLYIVNDFWKISHLLICLSSLYDIDLNVSSHHLTRQNCLNSSTVSTYCLYVLVMGRLNHLYDLNMNSLWSTRYNLHVPCTVGIKVWITS